MFVLIDYDSFVRVVENGKSVFDVVFSYGLTVEQKAAQMDTLKTLVLVSNVNEPIAPRVE